MYPPHHPLHTLFECTGGGRPPTGESDPPPPTPTLRDSENPRQKKKGDEVHVRHGVCHLRMSALVYVCMRMHALCPACVRVCVCVHVCVCVCVCDGHREIRHPAQHACLICTHTHTHTQTHTQTCMHACMSHTHTHTHTHTHKHTQDLAHKVVGCKMGSCARRGRGAVLRPCQGLVSRAVRLTCG